MESISHVLSQLPLVPIPYGPEEDRARSWDVQPVVAEPGWEPSAPAGNAQEASW